MFHGQLDELPSRIDPTSIDLFICSASFESRCVSIPEIVKAHRPKHSVVAFTTELVALVRNHRDSMLGLLGEHTQLMPLSMSKPIVSADSISKILGPLLQNDPLRIAVDITTFTRESLLIILRFIHDNAANGTCLEFLYSHAKEYSIGDECKEKWLSKGIQEVRSVLGFPGDLLPSRRNHLIVLVGFEDERALSLIRECEPSLISLGIADEIEPGTTPHQLTNIHNLVRLTACLDSVQHFTFKGYDAAATSKIIRDQMTTGLGMNTIIAPMNTKVSTVGAAMLAIEDDSIQICYAEPNIYNYERYSIPDVDFYHFQLDGLLNESMS